MNLIRSVIHNQMRYCAPQRLDRIKIYDEYPCLKEYSFPPIIDTDEGFSFVKYECEDKSRLMIMGIVYLNGSYKRKRFIIDISTGKLVYTANIKMPTMLVWKKHFSYKNLFVCEYGYSRKNYSYSIIGIYNSSNKIREDCKDKCIKIMWLKAKLVKIMN